MHKIGPNSDALIPTIYRPIQNASIAVPAQFYAAQFAPQEEAEEIELSDENETEEIYLDEVIDDLYSVMEDKLSLTIGFHPQPKTQDDIDLSIGKRAKFLYDALVHSKNPSYEIVETALKFLALLQFVHELQVIAKDRTSPGMGLKPKQIPPEDLIFGKKAHKLAINLIEDPSDEVIETVDIFLKESAIIAYLENIADENLNKTEIGFRFKPSSKENKQIGEKAELLAKRVKVNPNEQNLLLAFKFIQIVQQLNLMEGAVERAKRKDRCMGYHCDAKKEESYALAA
ncbi:MAG: hypothetical protein HYZ79_06990 [Candidatus Melainabacteria bacterium]|nr:hypothetical protein [Candidatus Melainabacteria bacterium]